MTGQARVGLFRGWAMPDRLASASATIARTRDLLAEARDINACVCRLKREIRDVMAESRRVIRDAERIGAAMDRVASIDLHGLLSVPDEVESPDRGSDPRGSVAR